MSEARFKTETEQHENLRKQLWIQVAVAMAGAAVSMTKDSLAKYANAALDAFDERFKAPINENRND